MTDDARTVINLGAGIRPLPEAINVDIVALPGIDLVHDLDILPWPLASDYATRIIAHDVFEHVNNPVGFMTECWRILRPGAPLELRVPHWQTMDAWTDPTHRRACTEYTFDYWIPGTGFYLHNPAYGGVSYTKAAFRAEGGSMVFTLRKALRAGSPPAPSLERYTFGAPAADGYESTGFTGGTR